MVASATLDGTGLNVGAAYVFERDGDTWTESQRLIGHNTTDGDELGYALDMRGDFIAIGGPYNEARGLDAGAVYIFERSGSQWVEQAMLVASNGGALYNFGISVKWLADDLLVIGSTGESSSLSGVDPDESNANASAAGAIYVFGRNGDNWAQEAYVKAAFPGENDAFGTSLSFSNGKLAIGAYMESGGKSGVNGDQLSNTSSASGAVYLFE